MYTNLIGLIAIHRLERQNIANFLNIHVNSLRNKLNGKSRFTIEEAFKIKEKYFPNESLDFIFAISQQKTA